MTDTDTAQFQPAGACTWCGHRPHRGTCDQRIRVPSGGPNKPTPTKIIPCPCRNRKAGQ